MEPDDLSARPPGLLERLKYYYAVYLFLCTIAGAALGALTVGLTKFTVYYLAEQSSIENLRLLNLASAHDATHLSQIDDALKDEKYSLADLAKKQGDLAERIHRLEDRAEADMSKINTAIETQNKSTQQILLLLTPQPKGVRPQ